MAVRDEANEPVEPDVRRQPRASVEREVGVSRAVEGSSHEGGPHVHSPAEQSSRRTHHGHSVRSQRRRRRLRLVLVVGALAFIVAPSLLVPEQGRAFAFLTMATGVLVMKGVSTLVALSAVTWRLRRHASGLRRVGYFAGVWAMSIGLGLVAARAFPMASTITFDAGVLVLFVQFLDDDRLRGERAPLAAG